MKNNKAQASTEYLVILAVVIIVALVVVGVLGGFINIGRGAGEQASKTYWTSADIGVLDWVMSNGSIDTLAVRNNLNYNINITNISVGGISVATPQLLLEPGETRTQTGAWSNCTIGSSYSVPVIFAYVNSQYNITGKTFVGIRNIEGTCVA